MHGAHTSSLARHASYKQRPQPPTLARRGRGRGFLLGPHMPTEESSGCELAQLVSYHVLCNVDRNMAPAIMDCDRMTDHLRKDCRSARPGLNHLFLTGAIHRFNFLQQLRLYVWALLQRSRHSSPPSLLAAAAHNELVSPLVLARLIAQSRLTPRRLRPRHAD